MLWIMLSGAFYACKKDKEVFNTAEKTDMLAKSWQYNEIRVSIDDQSGTVYKRGANPDDQDNSEWRFTKDNKYAIIDDLLADNGTWQFADNGTRLALTSTGEDTPQTAELIRLDAGRLEVRFNYDRNSDVGSLLLVSLYATSAGLNTRTGSRFTITYQLIPRP